MKTCKCNLFFLKKFKHQQSKTVESEGEREEIFIYVKDLCKDIIMHEFIPSYV